MPERILIRDLMTVGVPTCPRDANLQAVLRLMLQKEWEAVAVLDENGHAIGYVGRRQIVGVYSDEAFTDLTAEDVMDPDLPSAPPDIPLLAAAQIMQDRGVRVLYITHHAGGIEYPAAWLTYRHLLRQLSGEDLSDAGIAAAREAPLDVFLRRREEALRQAQSGKGKTE